MIILLGSISFQKENILHNVLKDILKTEFEIIPLEVSSGIVSQPLDMHTTICGATNRARNAAEKYAGGNYDFSFGLEGGLEFVNNIYNLVCVAVLVDRNSRLEVGCSRFLPLPKEVSDQILRGGNFGELIREYCNKENLKIAEKMTAEKLISRQESFKEAIIEVWNIHKT